MRSLPWWNNDGRPEIPLGNSANFLFFNDDSLEMISTESRSELSPYPPAIKMDFGSTEMKSKKNKSKFEFKKNYEMIITYL